MWAGCSWKRTIDLREKNATFPEQVLFTMTKARAFCDSEAMLLIFTDEDMKHIMKPKKKDEQ